MELTVERTAAGSSVEVLCKSQVISENQWARLTASSRAIFPSVEISGETMEVPLGEFLLNRKYFLNSVKQLRGRVIYGNRIKKFAESWTLESKFIDRILSSHDQPETIEASELKELLVRAGWNFANRELTPQQYLNVVAAISNPHGANFSVPGSGKTTSSLALFFASRELYDFDSLLVVCPRSAFKEWEEALGEVQDASDCGFLRLTDGSKIPGLLNSKPKYSLITYHQLVRVVPEIEKFLAGRKVQLILDESHRIKAGSTGAIARACLRIAPLAARRDVLSGTPMPQDVEDLNPQLDFLYPGSGLLRRILDSSNPSALLKKFYVRTKYSEIGVKPIEIRDEPSDMSLAQQALYGYLGNDLIRMKANIGISDDFNKRAQVCVMRLIQSAIDPLLAANAILNSSDELPESLINIANEVLSENELGGRLESVILEARREAANGKKSVIWAPFIGTIETLCRELSDLGAMPIYGKPTPDPDDEGEFLQREKILGDFLSKREKMVLVVNSAISEGINLHQVCQHAIYAGRTYNAAHYLQSRDRINRLNMPPGTKATMTIHWSKAPKGLGSIDKHIDGKLSQKVTEMARLLDDEDLRIIGLETEDFSKDESEISMREILDLIESLASEKS